MSARSGSARAIVRTFREASRGRDPRALVDGWHLLREAAGAGLTIDLVAISDDDPSEADAALVDRLVNRANVVRVPDSAMSVISPVRTPSGVAALVHRRTWGIGALTATGRALVVVVVDLQDPGNVGAVLRSAEAGGATGVVLAGVSADPWGWKALRAAMGSTFRLPVRQEKNPAAVLDMLRALDLRILAAVPRGGASMHDLDLRGATALVLGGEGAGLDDSLIAKADGRISIPMASGVESLNAAVAAGLLVYEARRQRSIV